MLLRNLQYTNPTVDPLLVLLRLPNYDLISAFLADGVRQAYQQS